MVDRRHETAHRERGSILALGFGTTVAMWIAGYVLRLPGVHAPGAFVAAVMLALMLAGGYAVGRLTSGGVRRGVLTGLLVAVLNMLILGSLLSGEQPGTIAPSALIWIPGALAFGAATGAVGAALGSWRRRATPPMQLSDDFFVSLFAIVAAAATLALVSKGGIVTSAEAGLAVVDWPNSFGYNMFLYPLSRMTGGIFYEHAHRLMGALVGLTTLALTGLILATDKRGAVRAAAVAAFVLVCVQGVLGGLRVTGSFTLSTSPEDMRPSLALAMVHGITGQVFFALLAALATVCAPAWRRDTPPRAVRAYGLDASMSALLVAMLVVQLAIGAFYRHAGEGLLLHIAMATFVAIVALVVGVRTWGIHGDVSQGGVRLLGTYGRALMILLGTQICLGIAAFAAALAPRAEGGTPHPIEIVFATAHQVTGAILLATAVSLALWTRRLLAAEPAPRFVAGMTPHTN